MAPNDQVLSQVSVKGLRNVIPGLSRFGDAQHGSSHDSSGRLSFATLGSNKTLLSLPAEIRNMIYKLVLGGQTFHTHAHSFDGQHEASEQFQPNVKPKRSEIHLFHCIVCDQPDQEWLGKHLWTCLEKPARRQLPNVEFLRTCRQIYNEACLVPYSVNKFIFISPSSLEAFLTKVLTPIQATAIRTMAIWYPVSEATSRDTDSAWDNWRVAASLLNSDLCSGIQNFEIVLSVFFNNNWGRRNMTRWILELGSFIRDLHSLHVLVTFGSEMVDPGRRCGLLLAQQYTEDLKQLWLKHRVDDINA